MRRRIAVILLAVIVPSATVCEAQRSGDAPPLRSQGGLQALYDFGSADGNVVHDRSGIGEPLHLRIGSMDAVRRSTGSLEVHGQTLIQSDRPATKIIESVRWSGEITIEAWVQSARLDQSGPARIVSISKNSNERNVTVGQDGDRFEVRLRTSTTSNNGIPAVAAPAGSVGTELTHIVYARDRTGRTRIYRNGELATEGTVAGVMANWDGSLQLALANELTGDRPWQGTYHLVAIYCRDLLPHEVERHFRAGPDGLAQERGDVSPADRQMFEEQVAPILAGHCLECHDTATSKGDLDLSRRAAAFEGGESGPVIVPGSLEDSLLWDYVETDEMPLDREPLSAEQKERLKTWIESGAPWTWEVIDPAVLESRPAGNWVQRLTVTEYIHTVASAVGIDIEEDARRILPPDLRADGFSNTAYNLNVDLGHIQAYAELAQLIVARMDVPAFAREFAPGGTLSAGNLRPTINGIGEWLLRGPLDERELQSFVAVANDVISQGGTPAEAIGFAIEAMLQSPRFIYRIETQRGDGSRWPLGDFELASRLSYIVWGGPPDRELLRAAESGELYDRRHVRDQLDRMLQDPRAVRRSLEFAYEWLDLGRLDNLRPNRSHFPQWDASLAADMRAETLEYFREVAWTQERPLADLMNAQVTFLTPPLARHYGLEPAGPGMQRYDLTSNEARGGLLTHGSILTIGGDEASMVTRGLFVLQEVLRGSVKDPPPCVDTTPIPTQPGLTQRGIAEVRISNANCGGCHVKFEPLAFGLEKFDGIGAFHEVDEHGNELREDGELLIPGSEEAVSYDTSRELMDLLAGSDRVAECLTWKLTQFCLGRPLVASDIPALEAIHREAVEGGGTYASTITAIVMSDLVQTVLTEPRPDR